MASQESENFSDNYSIFPIALGVILAFLAILAKRPVETGAVLGNYPSGTPSTMSQSTGRARPSSAKAD